MKHAEYPNSKSNFTFLVGVLLAGLLMVSLQATAQPTIFGTTSAGGDNNKGTIYTINPDGSGFVTLHHFTGTDGSQPQGTLVRISSNRVAGVARMGGGASELAASGTLFSINTDGSNFQTLYTFEDTGSGFQNGKRPGFGLLLGSDGKLYGTTSEGGTNGGGTLFRINADGTGFLVLAHFGSGGSLYGVPVEVPGGYIVFSFSYDQSFSGSGLIRFSMTDPSPGRTITVSDVFFNYGSLNASFPATTPALLSDGKLYGTTFGGGANGRGIIYKLNPDGSGAVKLMDLPNFTQSFSGLTESQDGTLFGAFTRIGSQTGALYKIDKDGTGFSIIKETNASGPATCLAQATDGAWFGYHNNSAFNSNPGFNNDFLFKVAGDGSNFTSLHAFGAASTAGFNGLEERRLLFVSNTVQPQTITFSLTASTYTSSGAVSLTGTSTSGMALIYTSSNPAVAKIVGNTVVPLSAGNTTITAKQTGNYEFTAAAPVALPLTVLSPPDRTLDSLALVDFYNAMNGAAWTNRTNWLSGSLNTWFGITLNGVGRVTALSLPGNQVQGTIPPSFMSLAALQTLNLSNNTFGIVLPSNLNQLTSLTTLQLNSCGQTDLPSMVGLVNLTTLNVANNSLTFEDLEPIASIPGVVYNPQTSFGSGGTSNIASGNPWSVTISVGGSANDYQWYNGASPVGGANSTSISIPGVTPADAGAYQLQVTSPLVPGLTLNSVNYTLNVAVPVAQNYFTWPNADGIINDTPTDSYGGYWADIDNDGDDDLAISNLQNGTTGRTVDLYENVNGVFTRLTTAGMPTDDGPRNVTWADFDNDGDLDFYIGDAGFNVLSDAKGAFYRNNGNKTFTRIDLDQLADGGAWADYDNDGLVDLFTMDAGLPNTVYRNLGNGTFELAPVTFASGSEWTLAFADIDDDHDLDLVQVGKTGTITNNNLYRNDGGGVYTYLSSNLISTDNIGSARGGSWADIDNDGDMDFFALNASTGGAIESAFYLNDGSGNFTKQPASSRLGVDVRGRSAAFGDLDNDGDIDLAMHNGKAGNTGLIVFLNNGNGTFTQIPLASQTFIPLTSPTLAQMSFGDANSDGFLDIFSATFNVFQAPAVYRNVGNSNHWVKFRLQGTVSNRSGVGARVEIKVGASRQIREVTTQTGLAAQNSLVQHFGIGTATQIDTVKIYWPSGIVQVLLNVGTNQMVTVQEAQTASNPTVNSSAFVFSGITTDSLKVSFTPGNGQSRIAVLRPWNPVAFVPQQNATYTVDQDLGNGQRVVYLGSGNQITLGGLQPDTKYYLTLFEFSGDTGAEYYLVPGGGAFQNTLPATMWGSYGSGIGQFINPIDIEIAPDGTVLVVDYVAQRVQKFTSGGGFLWEAYVQNPYGAGIDNNGNIYVVSVNGSIKVTKLNPTGVTIAQFVSEGNVSGKFQNAYDITIDSKGLIYLLGYRSNGGYLIEKYDSAGQYMSQFAGPLSGAERMDIDSLDNIYVGAFIEKSILKWNSAGLPGTPVSISTTNPLLPAAYNVDVSSLGYIYTNSSGSIVEYLGSGAFSYDLGQFTIGGLSTNHANTKLYFTDLANRQIQVIDITKQDQLIAFDSLGSVGFRTTPYALTASTASSNPVQYTTSNRNIVSVAGNQLTFHGLGSVTIQASVAGTHEYKPGAASRTITVVKGDQTITFPPIPDKEVGDVPFYLEATASSGRTISYSIDNPAVATITGDRVRIIGPGTATITASQAGDALFNAATSMAQSFNVAPQGTRVFGLAYNGGAGNLGTVYSMKPDGSKFQVLYNFGQMGQYPEGAFELASDGFIYGSTQYNGNGAQTGTLFKFKPDFSEYYHLKEFGGADGSQPQSIVLGPNDGYVYGNTFQGGAYGLGTLFKIKKDGSGFLKLYDFNMNGSGKIMLASDGAIYGVTQYGGTYDYGVIYRINRDGTGFTVLHNFTLSDGIRSFGPLTEVSPGLLVGTGYQGVTYNYGTIFSVYSDGSNFTVLRNLSLADGANPTAKLYYSAPYLYGGSNAGGPVGNEGALFRFKADGSDFSVIHDFDNTDGSYFYGDLTEGPDGRLYGGTFYGGNLSIPNGGGALFGLDKDGGNFQVLKILDPADGYSVKRAPIVLPDSSLLFTTYYNNTSGGGSVLKINPNGSNFRKVVDLGSKPFGQNPEGVLSVLPGGHLVGVSRYGGSQNKGLIYSLKDDGSSMTILHDFTDKSQPSKGVLVASDGKLYGATSSNSAEGGVVYAMNADGSGYTVIANFEPLTLPGYGDAPTPLIELPSGELVGATFYGGANSAGSLYRVNKNGTGYQKFFDFSAAWGSNPSGILQASDGKLYITCYQGGDLSAYIGGFGDIVRINADGTNATELFDFTESGNSVGKLPYWGLIEGRDGRLFGTASFHDGNNPSGLVFAINKDGSQYTVLKSFSQSEGYTPDHGLVQASDGSLYGTTAGGGANFGGLIFKVNPDGSSYTVLKDLDANSGTFPVYGQLLFYNPNPQPQTITFSLPDSIGFSPTPILLTGSASSGLPVKFVSSDSTIARVSGNALTILRTGAVTISASQGGNYEFGAAAIVSHTIVIKKGTQTILSNPIPFKVVGEAPFAVNASSTSGLPVQFSSSDTTVATIKRNIVIVHNPGIVNIILTQPGNSSYKAVSTTQPLKVYPQEEVNASIVYSLYQGGAYSNGTIIKLNLDGTGFTKLHDFDPASWVPTGTPVAASNGYLYGTTLQTVYRINSDGSDHTIIHNFNGYFSEGGLTQGSDGSLYGTTLFGGVYNKGIIYKIDPGTTVFTMLHEFNGIEGANPTCKLIQADDGWLYGVTQNGGTSDLGIIFKIKLDGTGFTKLQDFDRSNGANPFGSLVQASNGALYGATYIGGTSNTGTLFRINTDGTGFAKIQDFIGLPNGASPYFLKLKEDRNGNLIGMTQVGGSSNQGVIFKISSQDEFTKILDIAFPEVNPLGSPAIGYDGRVYGQSNAGGNLNLGTLFRLNSDGTGLSKLLDLDPQVGFGTYYAEPTFIYTLKQPQSITFDSLQSVTVTTPPFKLNAIASSGLAVSYTSSDTTVAKLRGDTLVVVGPGTAVITARQPGNNTFKAAAPVSRTLVVTDPVLRPTSPASNIVFSSVFSTQLDVSFSPGNGTKHLVVVRPLNAVTWVPQDGADYFASANVSQSPDLGGGTRIVSANGSTALHLTGLSPATKYYFTVYEFNGTATSTKYLATGAPSANRTTLALPNVFVQTPANNAVNQNVSLNVTSSNLTGATVFTIELSRSSDFSDTTFVKSGGRTQAFAGLSFGTQYFNRVKTDLSPDYGPVRSFTTAPAEFFSYVTSPANNATGVVLTNLARNVSLNNVIGATTYTCELNTSPNFDGISQVKSGGRTLSFTGLTPGTTYYNRVKTDLSPNWGQTRQFTTAGAALLTYVVTPGNNAVNVSYQPTVTVSDVGATSYTVQLSPTADFSSGVIENTSTTRTLAFTGLLFNTLYYSRAKTELDPAWGPTRMFTTTTPLAFSYMTSPANNAVNVNYVINISSQTVPGATSYTIEANTLPDFTGTSIAHTGTRTMSFNLSPNQTYYVRVGTDLLPGQWGVVRSFTTTSSLVYSYITSPVNGATNVPYVTNITSYNVPLATSYIIEANTLPDFTGISIVKMGTARTYSFTLAYNQVYYVRVQTNLAPGEWGPSRSFTTGSPQSLAYVTSPANGVIAVPTTVNVSSNAVPGATSYTIELNTDAGFTGSPIVRSGTGRTKAFAGLIEATTYYARVYTNLAPGLWGPTTSFSTINPFARQAGEVWVPSTDEDPVVPDEVVEVRVFPNPFADSFEVHVQTQDQQPLDAQLLDMTGRAVFRSREWTTNHLYVIQGEFSPGVYLLDLRTNGDHKVVRVIRR